jgi:hypothetical protein
MSKKINKNWFRDQSNYIVGLGVGFCISFLVLYPGEGQEESNYYLIGCVGIALVIVGGILGVVSNRAKK